jgi:hypothetical protein
MAHRAIAVAAFLAIALFSAHASPARADHDVDCTLLVASSDTDEPTASTELVLTEQLHVFIIDGPAATDFAAVEIFIRGDEGTPQLIARETSWDGLVTRFSDFSLGTWLVTAEFIDSSDGRHPCTTTASVEVVAPPACEVAVALPGGELSYDGLTVEIGQEFELYLLDYPANSDITIEFSEHDAPPPQFFTVTTDADGAFVDVFWFEGGDSNEWVVSAFPVEATDASCFGAVVLQVVAALPAPSATPTPSTAPDAVATPTPSTAPDAAATPKPTGARGSTSPALPDTATPRTVPQVPVLVGAIVLLALAGVSYRRMWHGG